MSLIERTLEFFAEPVREVSELQRRTLESSSGLDLRTVTVLVSAALLLTFRSYFFQWHDLMWLIDFLAQWWPSVRSAVSPENVEFTRLAYWAIGQDLLYVAFPVIAIKFVFRDRLADYGLKLKGMFYCCGVYVAMLCLMAPLIVWLSHTDRFQAAYPFYQMAPGELPWPRLVAWELLYATQFVALEFFFRGFMVHGTKHRFGAYSVLVMMVPYCMIHFSKPLPETMGAILAGVALGMMSLKTRSIWLGAAVHICVAWSMDGAALLAAGRLG